MAKDLKYFMRDRKDEIVTVPGPETFVDDEGNVIDLEIRVMPNSEIQRINKKYQRRTIATDKKGQPYISNGEVVYKTEKDAEKAVNHIIVEALQYPNLKDKELMDYYGCVDITEMPQNVFWRSDEYTHVSRAVMIALGLMEATDDDEVVKEAKNS